MWQKIFSLFHKPSKANAGKRILVVDDGEVERKTFSQTLQKSGYKVSVAASGEEGLNLVNREMPDLILLDFMMPGISGKEVCQRLKRDKATKHIPIIFLTGSAAPSSVVECYDVGADYYLSKPISAGALLKQIELTFQVHNQPDSSDSD